MPFVKISLNANTLKEHPQLHLSVNWEHLGKGIYMHNTNLIYLKIGSRETVCQQRGDWRLID